VRFGAGIKHYAAKNALQNMFLQNTTCLVQKVQ